MNKSIDQEVFELEKRQLRRYLGRNVIIDDKGYVPCIDDNLYEEMDPKHVDEYERGSGNELQGKMRSVRSSSAMTFNLLGNVSVNLSDGKLFKGGKYVIEYEKQFRTLKSPGKPANLDAFLYSQDNTKEEQKIFCEMKMTEWMANPSKSSPGRLKDAYTHKENYYDPDAGDVFIRLIDILKKSEEKKVITSIFDQYDAWQMFKHTIAIFNGLKTKEHTETEHKEKVLLLNVVWQPDDKLFDENQKKIKEKTIDETKQSEDFKHIMMDNQYGLKQLFADKYNADFSIEYISVNEFVKYISDVQRIDYLKRYTFI